MVHVLQDMTQHQATALCARLDWELRREIENDARERLTGAAAAAAGASAWSMVMAIGKPYREVLRIANERDAALIVMGIHDRAPLHRRFLGSNAEHVVRESECPG